MVHEVVDSPGEALAPELRGFMEPRFGHAFSQVRVHADPRAAASAEALSARAYAVGEHVVFGANEFAPATPAGRRLLAHELTHVVQQRLAGGQRADPGVLPPGTSAETEADHVASRVLSGVPGHPMLRPGPRGLQRQPWAGGSDPLHQPLIEDFRRRHGLPPGGVNDLGNRSGPSDAEIKYRLAPAEAVPPPCPEVAIIETERLGDPTVRRAFLDTNCISNESRALRPACSFTPRQQQLLRSAQQTAAARVQLALDRIGTGATGRRFATELAGQLFANDAPSVAEMLAQLRPVRDLLSGSTVQFAGRTCGDETCQRAAVVAYVEGPGQLPVFICPTAFSQSEGLHRTVLHEALHWSGLDADPSTPEGYCAKFDCRTPCLTKQDADAWTHFLDCLGKPLELRRSFRQEILDSVREIP